MMVMLEGEQGARSSPTVSWCDAVVFIDVFLRLNKKVWSRRALALGMEVDRSLECDGHFAGLVESRNKYRAHV